MACRGGPLSASTWTLVACLIALAPGASAQTPELDRARALFTAALQQQQDGHPDLALGQFRQVAAVRDTSQVEYRIGTCLESLGKRRDAVVAYDRAAHLGRGDPKAADVVDAANARIAALARSMGTLEVTVQGAAANRAELAVDGEALTPDQRRAPLLLEPGNHDVRVTAPGTLPASASVAVVAGGRAGVTVVLAPVPPPPPAATWNARRLGGVVTMGAGVVALGGMGVALWVRHDRIAQVQTDCPGNVCPSSLRGEVESARSDAHAMEPVAAILGGVGAAALALGIVLVAWPSHGRAAAPSAWLTPTPGGLAAGGTF